MDRAGDEVLAGAALPGNQHRQIVALQVLDLVGHALHRRARADESGQERLELPLHDGGRGLDRALARLAQIEALAQHGAEHPEALR